MCLILDSRHGVGSKVKWSDSAVFRKLPSSIRLLRELLGRCYPDSRWQSR